MLEGLTIKKAEAQRLERATKARSRSNSCHSRRSSRRIRKSSTGFTSQQRCLFSADVLARFRTISFDEIRYNELDIIFCKLLHPCLPNYKQTAQNIKHM